LPEIVIAEEAKQNTWIVEMSESPLPVSFAELKVKTVIYIEI
jgi:hypothetical protein